MKYLHDPLQNKSLYQWLPNGAVHLQRLVKGICGPSFHQLCHHILLLPLPSFPTVGGGWGLVGETQLTTRSRCHNFVILIWSVSLTFVHFFLHTCKITAHSVAVAPWLCCALTWWCYCTLAVLPPPRGLQPYDTPCHFPLCWTSFMLCQTPRVSFPKCFSVFLLLLSFCQFL